MGREFKGYSLAELLADPIIGLVMKSDGVERQCLESLLARLGRERATPHCGYAEATPQA